MEDNSCNQSEIGRNNIQNLKLDITISDNIKTELLKPPEKEPLKSNFGNIENFWRFEQTQTLWTLYPDQIGYGFALISNQLFDNSNQPNPNFTSIEILFNFA